MKPAKALVIALLLATCAFGQDTRAILLGSGNPNPEPDRMGPSVAIVSGDRVYVVDAGIGCVRRAVQAGIDMSQLTRAFITHLHSDHTIGLPDLILTPAITGRLVPFQIFGPPGIHDMVAYLLKAYGQDIEMRVHGAEPSVPKAYEVMAKDIHPGEVYKDETVRVIAFPVHHGAWKYAYGYRFEAKDKTIVVSGDTTYSESLIKAAANCDILIHEVYSREGWTHRTPEWQRYHAAFHTNGPDVGKLAAIVKPRKLVLYHQLPMGQPPEQVLKEVRSAYGGEVIYGTDLTVVR
jgi:ribonuclease BN (tRNA processing enzyme)